MIGYETYCRIRQFHQERGLSFSQIARELIPDPETVAKYAALATFPRRSRARLASKLDPFKATISRWLERHPYSTVQIFQRLQSEEGYTGRPEHRQSLRARPAAGAPARLSEPCL